MRRLIALATAWLVSSCAVAASVTATWDHDGVGVDGFRLRYECHTEVATRPAGAGDRSLTFDVPDGETCSARMWAYNGAGDSEPSNAVTFTTAPLERPGRVTNLRISWTERPTEPEPTMDLIFSDNFNRANSGNLGANWQNALGSPAVASNQARKGTLSAFDESMALVSSWSQVEALEIRATTGGAGGGANPAIVFAQRLGVDMVVGFLLYFGTEGANLYFYDDINETYGVVAAGASIGTLTGVQVALSIETVGSALQFRAYRRDNDATTLTYTAPLASLPAHFNAPKPGLGFYDEASNTPWVDNFEVWVPSSSNFGDVTESGDADAAFAFRAMLPAQVTAAGSAGEAMTSSAVVTEQAALSAGGDAGAALDEQAAAVAAIGAAGSAGAAPVARVDAVAALAEAGSAQATPEAIAHVVAGITAAGAASDSAGSAGRLVEQLVASGTGDAAFDSLGRATAALLAGAAAGESWATDLLALADLLAQAPAQSHFSPDSTELRTVDLDEAGAAAATLVTRADTAATLLAQLTAGAGVAGQATAREALTAALSALASWSADGRVLEQAELTLAGAAAAQLVAQTEGIEQAAMQVASPAAEVFLAAVHSYADVAAAGDAGAVILAVAAAQGAVTAAVEAQAQWAAQESANRAEVINDGAATAVLTPDAQAVAALLQSSPAMALLQAFAVTQEEASVTGAASALGTFRFASVVSGDFVAAVSTAGLFSPSAVLVRADLAEAANAAASFHAFYTAPVGQLTGSVHIIAAMAGSAQVTTALAGGVGVGPALGSSIH